MARTPGAKNRTPIELRAEAKRLNEKASFLEKLMELKKEAVALGPLLGLATLYLLIVRQVA